ncbi:MAG: helix-turn-helix domain-containing protein [Oscillospiraceae bacterium]|nr:helix-turn-helix domain-containing protein [Oscillospiraceae bacterium]
MTIYLSETLRSLRRERDLTQEELAGILNVSPQAVSRWETGATYPDIALLPTLAEFFGVTVDELLGKGKAHAEAKVADYAAKFDALLKKGLVDDALELSRAAVRDFPNDYRMLNQLMYALFLSGSDDGDVPNWRENQVRYDAEIIALGERILKYCTDDEIRLEAKARLGFQHYEMGRKEQGAAIVRSLPSNKTVNHREAVLYWVLEGEERETFTCEQVVSGLGALTYAIKHRAEVSEVSPAQKIEWGKKQLQILDIVLEGEYFDWLEVIAATHAKLAELYVELKQTDEALREIEEAARCVAKYERLPEKYVFMTPLLAGLEGERDEPSADSRSFRERFHANMIDVPQLAALRNEPRFIAAEKLLLSIQ